MSEKKNNSQLVIDLLENKLFLKISPAEILIDEPEIREEFIRFRHDSHETDLLEGLTASFATCIGQKKRIYLPLDFDTIDGLDDLMITIGSFAGTGKDVIFQICEKTKPANKIVYVCKQKYLVHYDKDGNVAPIVTELPVKKENKTKGAVADGRNKSRNYWERYSEII